MKPHGFLIYLPPQLYIAIVKLQADKQLGRCYPVLYAINEGLFRLGYISTETYETFEKRYSQRLIKEEPKPLSKQEAKQLEQLKEKEKTFSNVLDQWNIHPSQKWRDGWLKEAQKYKDKIPNAKLVLALANEENNTHPDQLSNT
jgi:hypothetical protein